MRSELTKLCEPTLHYTYIDGKSVIGDKERLVSGGIGTPLGAKEGNVSQNLSVRDADGTFPDNFMHRDLVDSLHDGTSGRAISIWNDAVHHRKRINTFDRAKQQHRTFTARDNVSNNDQDKDVSVTASHLI